MVLRFFLLLTLLSLPVPLTSCSQLAEPLYQGVKMGQQAKEPRQEPLTDPMPSYGSYQEERQQKRGK